MRHMLSAVLESWSLALDQEDEEQGVAPQDESGSLAAPQYPARRTAPTILHERRLHALSQYLAKRTGEMPADMCQELLAHLHALIERDDHEFSALALSSLGRPPPSCVCLPCLNAGCARSSSLLAFACECVFPARRRVKRHKVECMGLRLPRRLPRVSDARVLCSYHTPRHVPYAPTTSLGPRLLEPLPLTSAFREQSCILPRAFALSRARMCLRSVLPRA